MNSTNYEDHYCAAFLIFPLFRLYWSPHSFALFFLEHLEHICYSFSVGNKVAHQIKQQYHSCVDYNVFCFYSYVPNGMVANIL